MNKILILSLIGLGIGLAAPAIAKDKNHQANGPYASATHKDARDLQSSRTGVPEPTYMAIQDRFWAESN